MGSLAAAAETTVQVVTRHSQELQGLITKWTSDRIDVVNEHVHQIPAADIVALHFPKHRVQYAAGEYAVLTRGDRVAISAVKIKDEQLTATWRRAPLRPALKVPLELVAGTLFDLPPARAELFAQLGALSATPAGNDRLRFLTGDELVGQLDMVDGGLVTFTAALGPTQLDQRRLRRLALDPDLADQSPLPTDYWILLLTDGSRCTVRRITPRDDFSLWVEPLVGESFFIPWHDLVRMNQITSDLVPLASRQPTSASRTEFLDSGSEPDADWQPNRNWQRQPLLLDGWEYTTGIGMTSQMSLTYAVEPGDAAFRAVVGIDDLAGCQGAAIFRILVDRDEVWSSEEISGCREPVTTPQIELAGKQTFALVVDFGSRGDIAALANWCDALIVRTHSVP